MVDPFHEIRERLSEAKTVRLNEQPDFIEAIPKSDDGFNVSLSKDGSAFTVSYGDGWHERFETAEDAFKCFGFGLSENCRLKIHLAGNVPHKWTVEFRERDNWTENSTTGLIIFPFSRKRHTRYRQNRITRTDADVEWCLR